MSTRRSPRVAAKEKKKQAAIQKQTQFHVPVVTLSSDAVSPSESTTDYHTPPIDTPVNETQVPPLPETTPIHYQSDPKPSSSSAYIY